MPFEIPPPIDAVITIATSTTESAEIDIGQFGGIAIEFPAAFTGVALTFLASAASGGTFTEVTDDVGAAISLTVAQATVVVLTADQQAALSPLRFVKLVSGTAEVANRTIKVIGRN